MLRMKEPQNTQDCMLYNPFLELLLDKYVCSMCANITQSCNFHCHFNDDAYNKIFKYLINVVSTGQRSQTRS